MFINELEREAESAPREAESDPDGYIETWTSMVVGWGFFYTAGKRSARTYSAAIMVNSFRRAAVAAKSSLGACPICFAPINVLDRHANRVWARIVLPGSITIVNSLQAQCFSYLLASVELIKSVRIRARSPSVSVPANFGLPIATSSGSPYRLRFCDAGKAQSL